MKRLGTPWLALGLLLALACESPAPPPAPPAQPPPARRATPPTELELSLLEVAGSAFARGELEKAKGRYRRALAANPNSLGARLGLARVAMRQGDLATARKLAREASSLDDASAQAHLLMAEIEEQAGDEAAARKHLASALARDPTDYGAHAAFERLSGAAPARASAEDPLQTAWRHPYDPSARLAAGRALVERGQPERALEMFEEAVWLTDVDAEAGAEALRRLRELDPAWSDRRVVSVHSFADETIRADAAWRARLRLEWRGLSEALDPALRTAFVPASMSAVNGSAASAHLDVLQNALVASAAEIPRRGLLAFFTERPAPAQRREVRLGQAEFLGRHLSVRLVAGELGSRTLVHEVMHIYGGVHIAPDQPSIMNPSGLSATVDPQNRRIAGLLRARRFGPGGVEANVFPFVDIPALGAAYTDALRLDLTLRRMGIERALDARADSRYVAADLAREAAALDPHLADVAQFTAHLYLKQDRLPFAIELFDLASRLYGPETPRGRAARQRADAVLPQGQARPSR